MGTWIEIILLSFLAQDKNVAHNIQAMGPILIGGFRLSVCKVRRGIRCCGSIHATCLFTDYSWTMAELQRYDKCFANAHGRT